MVPLIIQRIVGEIQTSIGQLFAMRHQLFVHGGIYSLVLRPARTLLIPDHIGIRNKRVISGGFLVAFWWLSG